MSKAILCKLYESNTPDYTELSRLQMAKDQQWIHISNYDLSFLSWKVELLLSFISNFWSLQWKFNVQSYLNVNVLEHHEMSVTLTLKITGTKNQCQMLSLSKLIRFCNTKTRIVIMLWSPYFMFSLAFLMFLMGVVIVE